MSKVLIVDDASFMRISLKTMLSKNGFEVIGEAKNGVSAITKYKQYNPDIVTMDITMPDMDGIEALKKIREYDNKAKVVMITAMGQEAMVKRAIVSGARSFIVKPFKEDQLVKALNKVLSV
ncbi:MULTISPECIES: response regulator [Clostridium]|uniref:Stage 0 sporulation protein A homolog n=2 Tax=Clostridium TaxID=1485 RepID=D8GKD3_CLOLD|nr:MULTISPECIES: response regulator [Clostridium]ADK15273.1 predicted chemotaxis protein CheY [Clostridium ljungdahlii DSM 13528]AGY74542.1 response regulator [Clostridium autoethanogenum DSM 10061]ALU34729.1 Response regulator receiver protein [Clostridium autoethanogenum DSM 10061]OAA88755.1 Chemotaxis protein CheY [Clostridium ljungdahlii DSM 13528]OVY51448.1 Chemotaxis protein CheY [Clostridium autoethanogenum]